MHTRPPWKIDDGAAVEQGAIIIPASVAHRNSHAFVCPLAGYLGTLPEASQPRLTSSSSSRCPADCPVLSSPAAPTPTAAAAAVSAAAVSVAASAAAPPSEFGSTLAFAAAGGGPSGAGSSLAAGGAVSRGMARIPIPHLPLPALPMPPSPEGLAGPLSSGVLCMAARAGVDGVAETPPYGWVRWVGFLEWSRCCCGCCCGGRGGGCRCCC